LNARGTPLTAADLIRNFVFQRLDQEGADTRRAYHEDWPFESKFWMKQWSVGRNFGQPQFTLSQSVASGRHGEDVGPQLTFSRFKSWVEQESGRKMQDLLVDIKAQAAQYEDWTLRAKSEGGSLGPASMAFYRWMQAESKP
jgi:hypothetical protein